MSDEHTPSLVSDNLRPPSYLAGYDAAMDAPPAPITAILPPADYTPEQRSAFVSGFIVGARDRWHRDLMDELGKGCGT